MNTRLRLSTQWLLVCTIALCVQMHAARMDTVFIPSAVMHREFPAVVVVPASVTNGARGAPAVYILHGYGSGPDRMAAAFDLPDLADRYGLVLVCPSGSPDSWYMNSPVDSTVRFETYIIREVMPWVETHYPVTDNREGRAITGISMGGHGALYLALRNPGVFAAAGSISGVLDLRTTTQPAALARVLGSYESSGGRWLRNSVITLVDSITPGALTLVLDSGTEDPFLESHRTVHTRLLARGVPHVYTERPGAHTHEAWRAALESQLSLFRSALRVPD